MAMRREGQGTVCILVGLYLASLLTAFVAHANDLERRLQGSNQGKILVLRGFYSGERLRYDSSGVLAGQGDLGDWTTDGLVQVDQIRSSRRNLRIKAKRLMVVAEAKKGFRFVEEVSLLHGNLKTARVEIEAALGDRVTQDQANAVLARIFLSPKDDFADLVPRYWRQCLLEGISGKNESCRFSPEIAAILGIKAPSLSMRSVVDTSAGSPGAASAAMNTNSSERFKVGRGVKPPKPLYQPNPSFSEPARKAKYQGIVTMGLIVDQEGLPKNIHILSPLGAGLDGKAVQAVQTWKFQPAQKDGQPVAVEIAVEVDFHLY